MLELALELAGEDGERLPVQMQALEDDRGAGFELGENAVDIGRTGERLRPPGDVAGVVVEADLCAFLDKTEGREANTRRADEPLDIRLGEERVETAPLLPGDDERLLLPVPAEELLGGNRVDRFR
jgi:hypothetical protein